MTGDVTINGFDAFTRYGINLEDGALSALLTPPSLKEFVQNESRLEDGKTVITLSPKYDARELTLPFHLVASTKADFLTKYALFCSEVLAVGSFTLSTRYQPSVIYHLIYQNCTQFRQFHQELAAFALKVTEPDPTNRSAS